jgi:Ni2+-binding GTPase involved in maturation of urease and hydrogenase
LAEAVEFDALTANRNIQAVRPDMPVITLSTKSSAGMQQFLDFLVFRRTLAREVSASQPANASAASD